MKKQVIILAVVLLLSLTACGKQAAPGDASSQGGLGSISSTSDAVLPNTTPDIALEEVQLQQLQTQAVEFAKYFPYAFETTSDIEAEAVGWYTFLKLHEQSAPPTDGQGMSYFAKSDVDAYVALRFGINDFTYPTSGRNDYDHFDAEKQQYVLYLIGEGPRIDVEIINQELHGNEIVYEMRLYNSAMDIRHDAIILKNQIQYKFEIITKGEEIPLLRAVSATEVS